MRKPHFPCKILITAGPTHEHLDPVRFITNSSTGTIGYELARCAQERGHKVVLISGPSHLEAPKGVKTVRVTSARQMKREVDRYFPASQCIICAAAVSDFRPARFHAKKNKKTEADTVVRLIKNPDILLSLGRKKKGRILVGFALETDNLLKNSREKLERKNLDLIIANKISLQDSPFGRGRFNYLLIDRQGRDERNGITKTALAGIILDRLEKICYVMLYLYILKGGMT
ncbi:MAG: phosphopantothenoylcysteine decarboxylase [Candidatus Omnitrophica bacterium]|nr:phosphopantothenoylcysteine decarboxylase [Candidatus Omnitrophota bacterium]MBU4477566.1 phosphopantothenoylcysteine decarboxylase [Candidatus Omnitrophota bacterium]